MLFSMLGIVLPLLVGGGPLRAAGEAPARIVDPPNVLLIVIDDMGDDLLAEACTPAMDALSDRGLTLANFYANPLCSPTRACLLTGRYGFRTGIGSAILAEEAVGLDLAEVTLAERLDAHDTWAVGKWHLMPDTWPDYTVNPNLQGVGWFAGTSGGLASYYDWDLIVQGQVLPQSIYATTLETTLAVSRMSRPGAGGAARGVGGRMKGRKVGRSEGRKVGRKVGRSEGQKQRDCGGRWRGAAVGNGVAGYVGWRDTPG